MSRPTLRDVAIAACSTSALVHAWLAAVHFDEWILAASFAAAALALTGVGLALTEPDLRFAPLVAAGLFAALLAVYPIVVLAQGEVFDALGAATKLVEAIGLAAALGTRGRPDSFGSLDALVGVGLGVLLLSLGHAH